MTPLDQSLWFTYVVPPCLSDDVVRHAFVFKRLSTLTDEMTLDKSLTARLSQMTPSSIPLAGVPLVILKLAFSLIKGVPLYIFKVIYRGALLMSGNTSFNVTSGTSAKGIPSFVYCT